jgi:acyl-CoA synthetase (AMP-forming)/AMP-acid ligase II
MRTCSCVALSAIAHHADVNPQAPALIGPNGLTLNYKDFWAQIEALGDRLREASIDSRQTVAVLLPQGPLQILAVAGVLSHCTCVPLPPKTTVAEVQEVL